MSQSVEHRMVNALLDLEGLLLDGEDLKYALNEAAGSNGFRPEVLRVRAERAFGPIEGIANLAQNRIVAAQRTSASPSAVRDYANGETDVPAYQWLTDRLGRPPTYDELKDALEASTRAWLRQNADALKD